MTELWIESWEVDQVRLVRACMLMPSQDPAVVGVFVCNGFHMCPSPLGVSGVLEARQLALHMVPNVANQWFYLSEVKENSFTRFLSFFFPPHSEKYQNCHRSGQDLCHNVFRHNLSAETPRNQN